MGILLYFAAAALVMSGAGLVVCIIRLTALARRQRATLAGVRS